MERIDGPGATQDNHFQDKDVPNGVEGTVVTSAWANAVQEELANIVERTGGHLQVGVYDQVLQAILGLVSQGGSGSSGLGTNQIINGEFAIFQRALTAPSGVLTRVLPAGITAYCLDRWEFSPDGAGGTGAATISRQPFTPGQTAVPDNPVWFARMAQGTIANLASPFVHTKLEDVARYSGGPASWSIYMRSTTTLAATMRIVQRFGAGGSGDVICATQAITLSPIFARYAVSLPSMPDVSGKVFGAGNHLLLELVLPTGQAFQLDLADTQFERNPAPTVFQRRSQTLELELARRYYEKSWGADIAAATCPTSLDGATAAQCDGTSAVREMVRRFRTEKRSNPTMTWFAPPTGTANAIYGGANRSVTSVSDAGTSSTGWPTVVAIPAGLAQAHWTADAEL